MYVSVCRGVCTCSCFKGAHTKFSSGALRGLWLFQMSWEWRDIEENRLREINHLWQKLLPYLHPTAYPKSQSKLWGGQDWATWGKRLPILPTATWPNLELHLACREPLNKWTGLIGRTGHQWFWGMPMHKKRRAIHLPKGFGAQNHSGRAPSHLVSSTCGGPML